MWLTRRIIRRYLANRTYLHLKQSATVENPDQRIAEDVRLFTATTLSFTLMFMNGALAVLSFSGVLWTISPWLPEPLVAAIGTRSYEMAESLSVAFLHLLESLSPPERAAFLLGDIFEIPYIELAALLETTELNCRQLVVRARKSMRQRRQRFSVDRKRHRTVLKQFLRTCASGDLTHLTAMLHAEVVLYSDGGGKVRAALNPIYGAERVIRFFAGIEKQGSIAGLRAEIAEVNGELGALIYKYGQLASVVSLQLDESGRIINIFLISNPDKLLEIPIMC